jgi:hypothetical protein
LKHVDGTSKKFFNCVLRLIKIEFDGVEFGAVTCGAYATRCSKVTVGFFVGNVGLGNWSYDHMFAKFGSKTWSIQYEWTSQELNEHLRGSISCKDLCVGKLYLHSTHIFGPLEL